MSSGLRQLPWFCMESSDLHSFSLVSRFQNFWLIKAELITNGARRLERMFIEPSGQSVRPVRPVQPVRHISAQLSAHINWIICGRAYKCFSFFRNFCSLSARPGILLQVQVRVQVWASLYLIKRTNGENLHIHSRQSQSVSQSVCSIASLVSFFFSFRLI